MKVIPLTLGKFAKVSDEDYERVVNFGKWKAWPVKNTFYARCYVGDAKYILLHWFITGEKGIDHKDRDGLNNQRENLRKATPSQNGANKIKCGGASKYKGVSRNTTVGGKPWRAYITKDGERKQIGTFTTEDEAALAYNKAASERFGEFARLNNVPNNYVN